MPGFIGYNLTEPAATFTMPDEEVYCVCYPTDLKPAFTLSFFLLPLSDV